MSHYTPRRVWLLGILVAPLLLVPLAWQRVGIGEASAMPSRTTTAPDSLRFVAHPDNPPVGWPSIDRPLALRNPLGNDAQARATGAKLYVAYNCVDCHGAGGGGSMGPSQIGRASCRERVYSSV